MTRYMHGKVNFAIKWYKYSNEKHPEGYAVNRDKLVTDLTDLGIEAANKDMEADFEEISILLGYLAEGKELKPVPLPEFSI
ncbi:hypothetical protein ACIU3Q_001040 [Salmonella enterica subsp. enterica serovar Kokomlemle]